MPPQTVDQFGQTIKAKHPEYRDLSDEDVATKVLAKYPQYRDMVETVAGAGPMGLPQPKSPTVDMQAPALGSAPQVASDLAAGALKGAGRTANNIGKILVPDALVNAVAHPSLTDVIVHPGMTAAQISNAKTAQALAPTNTAQKIGGGLEQAGEFMIPGPAEEAALAKLAPYVGKAAPLVKAGLAALSSGAVNKAQGGTFTSGAVAGGIGSGVAQGLKAVAPAIAESALNIRKLDRAYKPPQAIGKAILNETTGLSPGVVADSAQNKIGQLNSDLDRVLRTNSITDVDMASPRGIVKDAQAAAATKNAPTSFQQLQPLSDQLSTRFSTGAPIPQHVSPTVARSLKQGIGEEFVHRWNPDTLAGTQGTAAQVYHDLSSQIHSAAPGSAALDERMSALIPVSLRGESAELNAPTAQKVINRFSAHTGALLGGAFGAKEGYEKGGLGGAIGGGAIGLLAPEAIASPTGQMVIARGLNSGFNPAVIRAIVGAGLGLNRATKKADDQ